MERVFLHIEKRPDGSVNIQSDGDSAQLAGLAVNGVRQITKDYPEYADDMKAMIDKDYRQRRKGKADILFDWLLGVMVLLGAAVLLVAIGWGMHSLCRAGIIWLERLEDVAVMSLTGA